MQKIINGKTVDFKQMTGRQFRDFVAVHDAADNNIDRIATVVLFSQNTLTLDEILDLPWSELQDIGIECSKLQGFSSTKDAEKNSEDSP